jgi:hypothetical protein
VVLLLIYAVPALALGLLVGRAWVIALAPAFWLMAWLVLGASTDLRQGEGFDAIYLGLGVSGTVAAALGVALRKLTALSGQS